MKSNKLHYLPLGSYSYGGIIKKMVDFINDEQLKNRKLWKSFVNVFLTKEDGEDLRWRCEYWGKMMRGACLCYQYENDDELYDILKETVEDLLLAQNDDGAFTTYTKETEFQSWDMWGRKYILTSLLYFHSICKEDDLKNRILDAVCRHADHIIEHVGPKDGQIEITDTSRWWEGVNSCSILETFVDLYKITKQDKYIDYAEYIISTGGIKNGNLIEIVKEGKLKPHEFPENKAYETMSFFEGVYEYALVKDDGELEKIAIDFFESVNENEISITGNAGAEGEIFNQGALTQTEKPTSWMQETCVVVTWIRIMSKLLLRTGNNEYGDRLEISERNSFLGSINFNHQKAYGWERKEFVSPLPFDSYSPLYNSKRGLSTGGLNYMKDGSTYGCCACIGSAGIGLTALNSVMESDEGTIYINDYYDGDISIDKLNVNISGNYLRDGLVSLHLSSKRKRAIKLRIPFWAGEGKININGNISKIKPSSYFSFNINKGEYDVRIDFDWGLVEVEVNGKKAYMYGPLVLALDRESNPDLDLESLKFGDINSFEQVEIDDAQVAFKAKNKDDKIIFKDYASSGKRWDNEGLMTVWIKN